MKLAVKKTYCPTCQKLVRTHEEQSNTGVKFICNRCNNTVWVKEAHSWRYVRPE